MLLRKEVRVTPVPTWCSRTIHVARTKGRLPTSLSRLLPSRRRRLQSPEDLASRAVMGTLCKGLSRRLAMDLDPRLSTR
jgi:hypothetical protein